MSSEENASASVPWKWVATTAVSLLIVLAGSYAGFVLKQQSATIDKLSLALGALSKKVEDNNAARLVCKTEQENLKHRVKRIEREAANMLERWLNNQRANIPRPAARSMLKSIKKLRGM